MRTPEGTIRNPTRQFETNLEFVRRTVGFWEPLSYPGGFHQE